MSGATLRSAAALNAGCNCAGADVDAIRRSLGSAALDEQHAHLFSESGVFVSKHEVQQMRRVIEAVETTVALPAYQAAVLARAAPIARHSPRTRGVFLGFDFHVGARGPQLIEINTNAGGAFLNASALREPFSCCAEMNDRLSNVGQAIDIEASIVEMFLEEWRVARAGRRLRTVAIVDDDPKAQFLYLEFQLAQRLFESRGFDAFIVDAAELSYDGHALNYAGTPIDLVYNRLTDFDFAEPRHAALARAYAADAAVITPHPRAHALYSDKRNLVLLTDERALRAMGVPEAAAAILLDGIPKTELVDAAGEETWWRERKHWFFKPSQGFGSRGTYRGDKLTRRVFGEIMRGCYVAQRLAPAGERRRREREIEHVFKSDVRHYVYEGRTQLMAARLYQGQTTNFRTAGGGFAPVLVVNES